MTPRLRPSGEFLWGAPPRETYRLSTSRTEIFHVVVAFLVLTLDIAIVRARISVAGVPGFLDLSGFLVGVGVAAVAALTGFVAHEMAHKVVAQRHGFWAEFRMSPAGLFFSVATSLLGFLFALPGATVIGGMGSQREWGETSLAGPLVNLGEGGAFFVASIFAWPATQSVALWVTLTFLALVNGVFAAFNLLPLGPLDGRKVLRWNPALWAVAFGAALVFTVGLIALLFLGYPAL